MDMKLAIVTLLYLTAAILFFLGLKRQARVRSARQGNFLAAIGMLLAMAVTLVYAANVSWPWVVAGLLVGASIGAFAAVRVQMTGMPEMVALFNGSGGIASVFVALAFFFLRTDRFGDGKTMADVFMGGSAVTLALSIIIGGITFSGSVVAFAKLAGKMSGAPILFPGRHFLNAGLVLSTLVIAFVIAFVIGSPAWIGVFLFILLVMALALGVFLVIPIGGADMPVVISLLNSYSGIAASMTGFVLLGQGVGGASGPVLIICGALVGAAGLILTMLMCKAMNRSLANVLFGGFGVADSTGKGGGEGYTNVKEAGPEEMAMILEDAQSVVFAPGYGLAVAQAQHACRTLATLLESRGTTVKYAIHPVAGRMPGHMNVLLAEADVPYEQLVEMDEINPEFKNTDAVVVLGANDVVNPAALKDKDSPIWGMPILRVHEARSVFMVKRSLSPGFAGIRNELFEYENNLMVFGDAKEVLLKVIEELKDA